MSKILPVMILLFISSNISAVTESTVFGKITGIESRSWGMHVQTNFAGGGPNGCPVTVGQTYMYDFRHDNNNNGSDSSDEVAMILAAFAAQSDIAFHIYGCNDAGNRPIIGYVRLRK